MPPLAHDLCGVLGPPARRGSKINHTLSRFQETVSLVELHQLVYGARAIAFTLCSQDKFITKVFSQPTLAAI
jgi:hypothetical protein